MSIRRLNSREINEAQAVFFDRLDYARIRIREGAAWPNWLSRLGAWITDSPAPPDNAVALGNRIYFPRDLRTGENAGGEFSQSDMGWLMHELTHCWQYQQDGIVYLFQALKVQIQQGSAAYDYGGESGLTEATQKGMRLSDFNREQQADIVRHYYQRLKKGESIQAWIPYIREL